MRFGWFPGPAGSLSPLRAVLVGLVVLVVGVIALLVPLALVGVAALVSVWAITRPRAEA